MYNLEKLYEIAMDRYNKSKYPESENLFRQILAHQPGHLYCNLYLARIAIEREEYQTAKNILEKITAEHPKENGDVLTELGRMYNGVLNGTDALACLHRAITLMPNSMRVTKYISQAFFIVGQYENAIRMAERAVTMEPDDGEAYSLWGNALLEMRQMENALTMYEKAVEIDPDDWKTIGNIAIAQKLLGDNPKAKEAFTFANALNPLNPDICFPFTQLLLDMDDFEEASLILDKLKSMFPKNSKVTFYTGILMYKQGALDSAVISFAQAMAADEENLEIPLYLGDTLLRQGKIENAMAFFEQVIEKDSKFVSAYSRKAEAHLCLDDLDGYCQTINGLHEQIGFQLSVPIWGGESLEGKSILVYSEFGLEQFNVFVRYVNSLKKRGAIVHVQCSSPVSAIVARMNSVDAAYLPGGNYSELHYHCPLELLPERIGYSPEVIQTPYWETGKSYENNWQEKFETLEGLRVGIMWRKELHLNSDIYESIPLSEFETFLDIEGVTIISLQTSTGLIELEQSSFKEKIYHIGELENASLDERLSCIEHLDVLISPDSLTAQAACATGATTWILQGKAPKWYWKAKESKINWFPSAKIFEQQEVAQWSDVMANVKTSLADLIESKK